MFKKILSSNRVLAFIILFLIIWISYWIYVIFFVEYIWELEINSNLKDYKVTLYAKNIFTKYNYDCEDKICIINKLSPFDYEATFSKENYKTITENIKIVWKKKNKISINFIKDTNIIQTQDATNLTNNENSIENYKKWYLYFKKLVWLWDFYFKENWANLDFYRNNNEIEEKLFSFAKNENNNINILQIYWSDSKIFLSYWDKKFIYSLDSWSIIDFKLAPNVNYVKLWDQSHIYQIITDLWTYIFDENLKETSYFYLFKDYISLENNILWLIFKDEKNKFDNFWIKYNNKNIIINYNLSSLDRSVIFETDLNIDKFLKENDKIYIYDTNWKKYELKNY